MSDKTKKLRDKAMHQRRADAERERRARNPVPVIRCQCGHTPQDRPIWDYRIDHWRAFFFCLECAPPDIRADLVPFPDS